MSLCTLDHTLEQLETLLVDALAFTNDHNLKECLTKAQKIVHNISIHSLDIPNKFSLNGHLVTLVTEGGQGISHSIVHSLGKAGCKVASAKLELTRPETVTSMLHSKEFQGLSIKVDSSKNQDVEDLVQKMIVSGNKAGTGSRFNSRETFENECGPNVGVNLTGVFCCCQAETKLQHMLNNESSIFTNTTSKYKAAVLKEVGKPLVLEELSRKALKKGEVRIAVYCCGINAIDLWNVLGGVAQFAKSLPIVAGYEVSGEILEVGEEVKVLKPGQRVIGMHPEFQGGFAEEMVISTKDVWAINHSMSFETGATLVYAYVMALLVLSRRAGVKKEDSILITGGGGKLGLAAVDLAANIYKCKVIALCVSDDQARVLRCRGAFATIVDVKQDWRGEVLHANGGKGVNLIIDSVGGDVFSKAIQCLDDGGKVIVTGYASKKIPQVGVDELIEKALSVIGVSFDQYRNKHINEFQEAIAEVLEMANENLIKPYKAKRFSLEKVNEAFESLKDPKAFGKYVIHVKNSKNRVEKAEFKTSSF